jgi:hypothetical protein
VDPTLLASINGMLQGLQSLRESQELLVAGQQKLVEHLTQSMQPTMTKVVSSGDVSSLADDLSSVPETVVLDSRGWVSQDRRKRWYAVSVGRKVGIFDSKPEALKSVLRYPYGCYKGFRIKQAAIEWLALHRSSTNNAPAVPDNRSLRSSDSTHYEKLDDSQVPPRPINEILDVTKVGHDPSVGKAKELYGTSTEVETVLMKTLCPKGVTQTVCEQMMEASPDILQAPGKLPTGSSTTDTAALADSLANAVKQLADVQTAKLGLTIPRDTQLRNPNRNYFNDKNIKTPEDLESSREELESQVAEILSTMEATFSQILFTNGWAKVDIDLFLASGLLPNVMRSSVALYQALWLHLCTLTLKHPFPIVAIHVKHHADWLRQLRIYAGTRCGLIARTYVYLRDAKHSNYRSMTLTDKILALALPSLMSLKSIEPLHPEARIFDCTHCMSDLHLKVPCPAKRLKAKRARELAVTAARTIDKDPEVFEKLVSAE